MQHLIFLQDAFNSIYLKVSLYEVSIITTFNSMYLKVSSEDTFNGT